MTEARETTERAVVGCMLIDSRAIDSLVEQGGSASWFTDPQCRKVAQAVLERYEQGKIASDMLAINELGLVPMSWMDECIELVPTVAHTEHYVATLKGHADKDALIALERAVSQIVTHCTPETVQEARASIEAALSASLRIDNKQGGTISQAAHEFIDILSAPEAETTLLDWGHRDITDYVGRIRNELIWICAQPSVGKTAWALQHMVVLANQGKKVALASMESDVPSIAGRLISSVAPMNTRNLRQGRASEYEIAQARAAADKLSDNIMVTSGSMTIDVAYAWGKAMVRKGASLLIFDNSRHVIVNNANGRVDEMAIMSKRFKQLRDDTGVPVLVLHHTALNEKTGVEREAWSSDIRRDCDMLVFLTEHKDTVYPKDEHDAGEWCVEFSVKKHREGVKGGGIQMKFDKETQTFTRWKRKPKDIWEPKEDFAL